MAKDRPPPAPAPFGEGGPIQTGGPIPPPIVIILQQPPEPGGPGQGV